MDTRFELVTSLQVEFDRQVRESAYVARLGFLCSQDRCLSAPTLVIHGAEDPLFPLDHGRALADEIAGARLLVLEQTGHELPRADWDVVVPAILEHTSSP